MPRFGSIKRKELIYYLRQLGFIGPYSGRKHQFMAKEGLRVRIPNPHRGDIGKNLLKRILREAGIDKVEWEFL
jgi:predicted RNA binding protein YcfA (HicA-like mRNA interferase family)